MTWFALDTDLVLYRAVSATERETDWGGDIFSLTTNLQEAKDAFDQQLDRIKTKLGMDECLLCLSDHNHNFRKDIDPTYKSNRRGTRKPIGYVALCDWVKDTYKTFYKPSLEADDCLGILATMPANKGKVTIVSDDKDLLTVNCRLYRPMADEVINVTEQDADRQFLTQVLTGDRVDNYFGIPGVGPKKPSRYLAPDHIGVPSNKHTSKQE